MSRHPNGGPPNQMNPITASKRIPPSPKFQQTIEPINRKAIPIPMKSRTRIHFPSVTDSKRALPLLGFIVLSQTPVLGQTVWNNPAANQNWGDSANWSAGVPAVNTVNPTNFTIGNTSANLFPIIESTHYFFGAPETNLFATSLVGSGTATSARLDIRSGSLSRDTSSGNIGNFGVAANGVGPVLNIADTAVTGQSNLTTYGQGSGSLLVRELTIGAFTGSSGTLNIHTTGSVTATQPINIGGQGTGVVNLTSGDLNTNQFSAGLVIGNSATGVGTLNMEGGTMGDGTVNKQRFIRVGRNGTGILNQTGGAIHLGNNLEIGELAGSTGTVSLSGGTTSVDILNVGMAGSGVLHLSGNSSLVVRNFASALGIGTGTGGVGTVNASGGSLTTPFIFVGRVGTGTFNQSGSAISLTNDMLIGIDAGSTGTANLSGGTTSVEVMRVGVLGNGTLTVSGTGDLTVRNFNNSLLVGPSAGGQGTVNLDGGSLRARYVRGGEGTSTFNFNGGTLIATHFLADYFQGLTQANILSGGAFIDTNGNGVTIAQSLQGPGGLTKLGANTLTLGGTNTYAGGTTIKAGTLALGGSSSMPVDSDVEIEDGTLSVAAGLGMDAGTLNVTGAGATINLGAGATITFDESGEAPWSETGGLNITGNFVAGSSIRFGTDSDGLTAGQLAAIKVNGTGTYTLDETGFLIEGTAPAGYAQWASTNAPEGNADDDFDGDGVSNAVEFVLGGDKDTNDLGKLPTVSTSNGSMTFTFVRDQGSVDASVSTVIEVGTTLASWPDSYIVGTDTGSSSDGVTVTDNEDGTDTITLTLLQGSDMTKFGRLKVTVTP